MRSTLQSGTACIRARTSSRSCSQGTRPTILGVGELWRCSCCSWRVVALSKCWRGTGLLGFRPKYVSAGRASFPPLALMSSRGSFDRPVSDEHVDVRVRVRSDASSGIAARVLLVFLVLGWTHRLGRALCAAADSVWPAARVPSRHLLAVVSPCSSVSPRTAAHPQGLYRHCHCHYRVYPRVAPLAAAQRPARHRAQALAPLQRQGSRL